MTTSPNPTPQETQEVALNAACEKAHRYPYAVYSKPCSWPKCELTCKGREHLLSAGEALDVAATRKPPEPSATPMDPHCNHDKYDGNCALCRKEKAATPTTVEMEARELAEKSWAYLERTDAIGSMAYKPEFINEMVRLQVAARRAALEKAMQKVRDDCSVCGGYGCTDISGETECEYCGRPMAAIRAMTTGEEGK